MAVNPEQPEKQGQRPPDYRAQLALRLYNQPLMIEQSRLDVMVGLLRPDLEAVTPEAFFFLFEDPEPEGYTVRDGIAWIQIHRSFLRPRTYERIRKQVEQAVGAQNVRGILLDIDSPGGEVAGLFDLADFIFESRGPKPIWAIANDDAFSAAYAIASAADRVAVTRTGGVGSIGVIAIHYDYSAMDERIGVKATPVYSGERKIDYIDTEPLGDVAKQLLQTEVDRLRELFVETVARNRDQSPEAIRDTEAGVFFGPNGRPLLADAIENLTEVFQGFRTSIENGGPSAHHSDEKEHDMAKDTKATTDQPAKGAEAKGTEAKGTEAKGTEAKGAEAKGTGPDAAANVVSIDSARSEGHKAGADQATQAAAERTSAIRQACDLGQCPERFGEFLDSKLTAEEVGAKILSARATAGGGEVDGHHGAGGGTEDGPKIDSGAIYRSRETGAIS